MSHDVPDLSTLFDLLPIGAYRANPDGRLLHVNAAWLKIYGYSSQTECLTDDGPLVSNCYVDHSRHSQFRSLLELEGRVVDFVSEARRIRSKERIWIREQAHLVRDARGEALYLEGTVEDITQQHAATAALQMIPDRVWVKDINGVYLSCNDAFAAGYHARTSDIVGSCDSDWVDQVFAAHILKGDRTALQAGRPVVSEEVMDRANQTSGTLFEIIRTPLRDANERIIGIVGVARDIHQRKRSEALLREITEQLELAIMGADLGRWDHDLTVEKGYRMDEHTCTMLGRDISESKYARPWGHLIHPDDLPGTLKAMRAHLHGEANAYEAEYRARHQDGHWVWLSNRGKVVQFSQDGQPLRMVGTVMDISRRKQMEAELLATQAELQATLNALPDLVFEFSADGHYRAIHSHNTSDLIAPVEYQINRHISEILPQEAADICLSALNEALANGRSSGKQYSLELAQGWQWFELSVVRKPTQSGEEERLIAIARNISERKQAQKAIEHLAFHDTLTGLPNRRLLMDRMDIARAASQRNSSYGALLFLDLDKFKLLNDTYGHDAGDLLLQEVAQRLQHCVRAIDTVARLGGDEFVVLIQNIGSTASDAREHANAVGHKILLSLNDPYTLQGRIHTLTPSMGVTLFLGRAGDPIDIIKQADLAMYQAKSKGRNTLCFYETLGSANDSDKASDKAR
ncbi:MAG: diguanylate cyclase [Rhodoferax sp.]|nr:diguanylate cyclase [Rhodoferax sp.]